MSIWTGRFWKATAERAIATAAQVAATLFIGDEAVNAFEMDFVTMGGVALGGALLSVLKSLGANAVKGDGPGFSSAETLRD